MRRATAPWPRALSDASRVSVRVRTDSGIAATGALESFGDRIVSARFWDAPPALPMGTELRMAFDAPGIRETMFAAAEVRFRRDDDHDEARIYGFRIEADRGVRDGLSRFLAAALNRRRSYRAAPPAEHAVSATLDAEVEQGRRRRVAARVADISATGCSLELSLAADQAMTDVAQVGVFLPLTMSEDPVFMAARIRHRTLDGQTVRYGLAFDATATPAFRGQQDRIVREVMRWQRKTLTDVHRRIDFV